MVRTSKMSRSLHDREGGFHIKELWGERSRCHIVCVSES